MDAPQAPVPASMPETPKVEEKVVSGTVKTSKKKLPTKKILTVLGSLVLLAGSAYGGYWWRDQDAKKDSAQVVALKKQVAALQTKNSTTEPTTVEKTETSSVQPTASQLASIKESITSGNTAALQGRMASTVSVIIAASEGIGARTEAQAIGDLDYVIDAAATWDFSLPAATLSGYATGDYAQYFPLGALVGKSSEGKVVSFIFDSNAKIKTIFMAINADLL